MKTRMMGKLNMQSCGSVLRQFVTGLCIVGMCSAAEAESTRFYELEGFGVLLNGNPESTALSEDGAITLPPQSREWFNDPEAAFSAATAYKDGVAVARVDTQSVVYIDKSGKEETILEVSEAMVTSLKVDGNYLYVASGPPAVIQRVDKDGQVEVFHEAEAGYVWDMEFRSDGTMLLATGEPGAVVEVNKKGKGEAIFTPEQKHLRSLALSDSLGVFVGGGERGVVYRQAPSSDDFVAMFDTRLPEVVDLIVTGDYVYAAAVKGAAALIESEKSKVDVRAQLWQIDMMGTGQVLAGSNDEAIFDLAVDRHGNILASTGATGRDDPRGRIYAVSVEKRMVSLVYQSVSRRITQMVELGKGQFATIGGGGGRVAEIGGVYAEEGEFLTAPFDAKINSLFGTIQIFGAFPSGTKATASIRTGQTATPDDTWTKWSREIGVKGGKSKSKVGGRYMQVRLTLHGDDDVTPAVHRLKVAFLRQNLPPFVKEVVALRKGIALLPVVREKSETKVVTLNDKIADATRANSEKSRHPKLRAPKARQVKRDGALTVRWVAEDPNGDALNYQLEVRESGTQEWRVLHENTPTPFFTMNSTQLPDGHYQFRVQASDAPSNPVGQERMDTRESRSVLVDNTPPTVKKLDVDDEAGFYTATARVHDDIGPIREAVFSLNGGAFLKAQAADGILDGPTDKLVMPLGKLAPGSYHLMVRARDDAENRTIGELRFEVSK